MRHPADSKTWKDVDQKWPDFASETRNLRLALSSDGFNPFHGNRTDYSSWPVLLSIYNLPSWLCMKRRYIMLCLLISGPTEPGNDIDVFLQPLIEDLQELWRGKQMYDAYKKESFMLRGILLWTISDYPALGNLSGNVIKGYNACTICIDETKATRLVNYRKTVIMRHRRWFPRNHPYRRQKSAFDNTVEKGVAPVPLTGEEVFQRVQHLRAHVFGKKQRQPRWKKGEPRPVWKKVSIFFQLEYWEFLPVRHVLDVMHIEKNICEALLGTLLNIPGKTKDRESVRLDMAEMGIRTELRPKTPGNKEKIESELLDGHNNIPEEIRWIAEGPNKNVPTFSGYRINGVTFNTKERDDTRQVQCSGVCVVTDIMLIQGKEKNIEHTSQTYYGVITSIWELDYNKFRVPIFRCNWVDMNRGVKVDDLGYTIINLNKLGFVNDPFVLGKHVKQVCYIDDPLEKHWYVVLKLPEKNWYEQCDDENDGSVEIELENELHLPMFPNVDELDEEKLVICGTKMNGFNSHDVTNVIIEPDFIVARFCPIPWKSLFDCIIGFMDMPN
ncbi:uncharacterized protein LOC141686190 [Apium graveolens]|uniref:uncharacterized protein LOC141686190 n=1 Tax=Apium graveolens TaxID=4045 RepID=UPI003D7BA572